MRHKDHGFTKRERIVSQKLIDELFTSGQSHSLTAFPLRAVYLLRQRPAKVIAITSNLESPAESVANNLVRQNPCESGTNQEPAVQLLLSVPKRRFKHAVDRNRLKRQLREAYRLHKQLLISVVPKGMSLALSFIWLSDSHRPTADVESRVVSLLQRIAEKINSQ